VIIDLTACTGTDIDIDIDMNSLFIDKHMPNHHSINVCMGCYLKVVPPVVRKALTPLETGGHHCHPHEHQACRQMQHHG